MSRFAGRDYQLSAANRLSEVPEWTADQAREIACAILGRSLDAEDCTTCPGVHLHTKGKGQKDFKLFVEGTVPAGFCLHHSCSETVLQFNKEMWRRLFKRSGKAEPLDLRRKVVKAPEWDKKRRAYDADALRGMQRNDISVTGEWLRERSLVDPATVTTDMFLSQIYKEDERVLVFTHDASQGDYGFRPGAGWSKLGQDRREANERVERGPAGARLGVWYLAQPVTGKWHYSVKYQNRPWSRRRQDCVMEGRWRYMILESDEAPAHLWLNALVQMNLPIAALYSSGGRSIHALVEVNLPTKQWWDKIRDAWQPTLTTLGADGAALSAVRLTRLPGCLRHGKKDLITEVINGAEEQREIYVRYPEPRMQKLIYFNPDPPERAMMDLPRQRVVEKKPVGKTEGNEA